MEKVFFFISGKYCVNLYVIYVEINGEVVECDELKLYYFENWVNWVKDFGFGLDFNLILFLYEKVVDGFIFLYFDLIIREFWIRYCIVCCCIGEYFGKELGIFCLMNIWIFDGYKDILSDRLILCKRLKELLDWIFVEEINE